MGDSRQENTLQNQLLEPDFALAFPAAAGLFCSRFCSKKVPFLPLLEVINLLDSISSFSFVVGFAES